MAWNMLVQASSELSKKTTASSPSFFFQQTNSNIKAGETREEARPARHVTLPIANFSQAPLRV